MKRARPSSARRDSAAVDGAQVMRRHFMEHILPLPSHTRRHHDNRTSRPLKRTRHHEASPSSRPPSMSLQATPHFIYAPNRFLDVEKLLKARSERIVSVHIPSDHFTQPSTAVRNRFLWGTDVYTDDSDLVAVLIHTGYVTMHTNPPFEYLTVKLKLRPHVFRSSPPFQSTERYAMCSRAWGSAYNGARISVLSVQAVDANRKYFITPHSPEHSPAFLPGIVLAPRLNVSKGTKSVPRRSATSICFDMLNEPSQTYSIIDVTSLFDDARNPFNRLKREVLYVENDLHRFEICRVTNRQNLVRFGRVKDNVFLQEMLAELGVRGKSRCPLCRENLANVQELSWKEIYWDIDGVSVNGEWYPLTKLSFRKICE
ncbi:unnamed protein product [Agarophyton chilense]